MKKLYIGAMAALTLCCFAAVGLAQEEKKAPEKAKAKKVEEIEAVVSGVGQRTVTFQYERKGKIREEVVGIDDKTYIEKIARDKVTLRDLKEGDKVYIRYEPEAYTPAISVQVVGKGEVKKAGGED
jgi:hypothetical protein